VKADLLDRQNFKFCDVAFMTDKALGNKNRPWCQVPTRAEAGNFRVVPLYHLTKILLSHSFN
jgi:hypothetical protein